MRYLLFALLAFFALGSITAQQVLEVKYLQKRNTHAGEEDAEFFSNDEFAFLTTNGISSSYRYGQGGDGKQVVSSGNNQIKVNYSDAEGYVFFTDGAKRQLISRDLIKDQPFIIREDLPTFNWTIINEETREIGGYTCHKATTTFRGRSYVAWFAPKIPINAGPWKLAGLPGLILEATDRSGAVQFIFAGIKPLPASEDDGSWSRAPRKGISTSLSNFLDNRRRKDEEFFQKIASYPGVTITPSKKTSYFETSL